MDIINKIAVATDSFFKTLKKDIGYAAQFSLFVVTLGHYAPPRAKNQQSLESPVPQTPIDTRTLSQEEAKKLLDHLLPAQRIAFEESAEYQEYQKNAKKDDDGTNPFYSINLYYQQYYAKSFINENHPDQVPHFFLSPEYQDYLLNNPLNPFSSSIEDVYYAYDLRLKTETAIKDFPVFEANLEKFISEGPKDELALKTAFLESKEYDALLSKMKISLNYNLSSIIDSYNNYREITVEQAEDYLNGLVNFSDFIKSPEYTSAVQDGLPLPERLQQLYGQYSSRVNEEQELGAFIVYVKELGIFDEFSKSPEYFKVATNPLHTLPEVKTALADFEKRTFMEQLPADLKEEFEESPHYDNFKNNPFHTVSDLSNAYAAFEKQRLDSYLYELKETISPEEFQKFTESDQYLSPQYNTTVEGMEAAYAEFKQKSQSEWWPKSLW